MEIEWKTTPIYKPLQASVLPTSRTNQRFLATAATFSKHRRSSEVRLLTEGRWSHEVSPTSFSHSPRRQHPCFAIQRAKIHQCPKKHAKTPADVPPPSGDLPDLPRPLGKPQKGISSSRFERLTSTFPSRSLESAGGILVSRSTTELRGIRC